MEGPLETAEVKALNAILKNGDKQAMYSANMDDLFTAYGDVWTFAKEYANKYNDVPSFDVIKDRFPDLDDVKVGNQSGHYIDDLKNEYIQNRLESVLTTAGMKMKEISPLEVKERLQTALAKLDRFSANSRDLVITDFENAARRYEEVRERSIAMGGTPGVPTGVDFVDASMVLGMQPGDVMAILGYPARGKSAFGGLLAANAISKGYKPLIVSMEMSAEAVQDRIFTILGSGLFSNSNLMLGNVNHDDFREFGQNFDNRLGWIVDGNDSGEVTPNFIRGKIDQHHPDFVVLDYLQLFMDNGRTEAMTPRMMNLSLQIKQLAKATGIPIVVISSATPPDGGRIDGPPNVERSAWSRQLSYDSTVCFAIHRHDGTNFYEISCEKNRYGPLFWGILDWDMDAGIITERDDIEEVS